MVWRIEEDESLDHWLRTGTSRPSIYLGASEVMLRSVGHKQRSSHSSPPSSVSQRSWTPRDSRTIPLEPFRMAPTREYGSSVSIHAQYSKYCRRGAGRDTKSDDFLPFDQSQKQVLVLLWSNLYAFDS